MLYNSAVLISPKGELVGVHHKMHIPGEEKHYFMPGSTCDTYTTDIGNIGMSICYDGQFPEFTRSLALKGAEILCMIWNMPSFSNPPELLEHITATRAAENRMFAVSCNCLGVQGKIDFFGHSVISDPVGNFLATAGTKETIISAPHSIQVLAMISAICSLFLSVAITTFSPILTTPQMSTRIRAPFISSNIVISIIFSLNSHYPTSVISSSI